MNRNTLLLLFCGLPLICLAQEKKKVMFIGNSYTAGLPGMVAQMALSAGDTLEVFESSGGGQQLSGHSQNPQTLDDITNNNWDYVVLQEQSQLPSFPDSQVEANCYPFAKILSDHIKKNNSCKMPMFYMTWGRKNGDQANCAFFPPLCTYKGMDSMLRLRYEYMAKVNKAELSPVGAVWREVRESYPTIELYSPDESHPSLYGMYASASCFYAAIFRKNPLEITETMGLDSIAALRIREVAKKIVFDSLALWNIGSYDLSADFEFTANSTYEYSFKSLSKNSTGQVWNFEFTTDTSLNPTFGFTKEGKQMVKLTVFNTCDTLTIEKEINIINSRIQENQMLNFKLYPNPSKDIVEIEIEDWNGGYQYVIFNSLGKKISNGLIVRDMNLSLAYLPKGIYTFYLKDSTGKFTHKTMVKL